MVSLAFEKTGWLNRYLSYRAATPFVLSEQYRNLAEGKSGEEIFDDCLYKEVKENGIHNGLQQEMEYRLLFSLTVFNKGLATLNFTLFLLSFQFFLRQSTR